MDDKISEILERLGGIESRLAALADRAVVKEFYSVSEVAQLLGKADFTVREWCRLGRVRAEKRRCGRGRTRDWMISHETLQDIRNHGLLPTKG